MQRRVWALVFLVVISAPCVSRADETTIGIALTGTHGSHRESGGVANAPLIPAPILAVSHRFKRFEIVAEGLPPIGTIPVANNGLGMRDISLTYADLSLRYWNRRGTLAFGFGETLYNQRTRLLAFQNTLFQGMDINESRVVGTRYEAVARLPLRLRDFVEAQVALDPSMHGRFVDARQTTYSNGHSFLFTPRPTWESASQVDAGIRYVHGFGPYAISYGVRYLNYTAAFTERPWSPFADSNSLLMPYIAIQRTWGH